LRVEIRPSVKLWKVVYGWAGGGREDKVAAAAAAAAAGKAQKRKSPYSSRDDGETRKSSL